jgi:Protein of unknown function (DUF4232)
MNVRRCTLVMAAAIAVMGTVGFSFAQAQPPTTPRCELSDLYVSVGPPQGAAGSFLYPIVFTNTSTGLCRLRGYPGVSVLDVAHHQIGAPAARNGSPATTVTLAPDAAAAALVRTNDPGVAPTCRPVAAYLRVYPPDSFAAVLVPYQFRVCGAFDVNPVDAAPLTSAPLSPPATMRIILAGRIIP